jgi:hypothetical protein
MKKLIFALVILSFITFSCNDDKFKTAQSFEKTASPGFKVVDSSTAFSMVQHFLDSPSQVNHSPSASIQQINLSRSDLTELVADSNTAEINFYMAAYLPADTTIYGDTGIAKKSNKQTIIIRLKKYTNNNTDSSYEFYDAGDPTNVKNAQRQNRTICPEPPCRTITTTLRPQ